MQVKKKILLEDKGSSLLLTSMLLLVGIIVIGSFLVLSASNYRMTVFSIQSNKARYISEAGIYRAIDQLNQDSSWQQGFQNEPFGEGMFTVTISLIPTEGKTTMQQSADKQHAAKKQQQAEKPTTLVLLRSEGRVPPNAKVTTQATYDPVNHRLIDWKYGSNQ